MSIQPNCPQSYGIVYNEIVSTARIQQVAGRRSYSSTAVPAISSFPSPVRLILQENNTTHCIHSTASLNWKHLVRTLFDILPHSNVMDDALNRLSTGKTTLAQCVSMVRRFNWGRAHLKEEAVTPKGGFAMVLRLQPEREREREYWTTSRVYCFYIDLSAFYFIAS